MAPDLTRGETTDSAQAGSDSPDHSDVPLDTTAKGIRHRPSSDPVDGDLWLCPPTSHFMPVSASVPQMPKNAKPAGCARVPRLVPRFQ